MSQLAYFINSVLRSPGVHAAKLFLPSPSTLSLSLSLSLSLQPSISTFRDTPHTVSPLLSREPRAALARNDRRHQREHLPASPGDGTATRWPAARALPFRVGFHCETRRPCVRAGGVLWDGGRSVLPAALVDEV